jgi:tRNA(fMet)-specific endonuclease VapC
MATVDTSRICIDTTVFIGFMRGQEPNASAMAKAAQHSTCYVTAITAYELLFGAARANRQVEEQSLLSFTTVLPFSYTSAQRAATLHAELIRQNQDIGIKDVLIAAICLENNLPILTGNLRHFNRVPSLQVIGVSNFVSPR